MRYPNSLFLVSAALVLGTAPLTACGGGGGGPIKSPGPIDPPGPTEPLDPAQSPTYSAGQFAISGIDQIPQSLLKLSKTQMQRRWVIGDISASHANATGLTACSSYVEGVALDRCELHQQAGKTRSVNRIVTSRTGATPFTMLVAEGVSGERGWGPATTDGLAWISQEIRSMGTVKIASFPLDRVLTIPLMGDGNHPYLMVVGAVNEGTDDSWYGSANVTQVQRNLVDAAIAANKLIVVAGWQKDASGQYVRHPQSSGCKGLDSGCLWAQFEFPNIGAGTSLSTPQLSAALASVLAVFPDTTPENLAKFAKASAKKTGNGIPALLAQSGGFGVADFASMGRTIAALGSLPTGGRTNVTINGQTVDLSNRDLILSFTQPRAARYFTDTGDEGERERISFRVVPNGEGAAMAFTTLREGAFFASVGIGKYDSFFGYRRGHGEVLGSEYAAGHENLFLHLADVRSSGGHLVSRAEGRSLGLTAEQAFRPAEHLAVTLSASLEKFLGGEADIPFGEVRLNEGQWNRRLGLAAEYTARGGMKLGLRAGALFPNGDKPETHVGFQLHRAF